MSNGLAGFQMGQASAVQPAFQGMLMGLVDEWKKTQQTTLALKSKLGIEILGEQIKKQITPPKWVPTTKQETLEFETAKKGLYPEGYKEDLQKAINASNKVTDENKKQMIFQRMSGEYPDKSSELKRILLPTQKDSIFDDIINALRGE